MRVSGMITALSQAGLSQEELSQAGLSQPGFPALPRFHARSNHPGLSHYPSTGSRVQV
jgi:hypothetical protein